MFRTLLSSIEYQQPGEPLDRGRVAHLLSTPTTYTEEKALLEELRNEFKNMGNIREFYERKVMKEHRKRIAWYKRKIWSRYKECRYRVAVKSTNFYQI